MYGISIYAHEFNESSVNFQKKFTKKIEKKDIAKYH